MREPPPTATVLLALAAATGVGQASAQDRTDRSYHRDGLRVVGLAGAGTRLVTFSTNRPGKVRRSVTVTGLVGGDTRLVGIDHRVQDGML